MNRAECMAEWELPGFRLCASRHCIALACNTLIPGHRCVYAREKEAVLVMNDDDTATFLLFFMLSGEFIFFSLSLVCVSMCENNRKMKMHSTTHAHRMIFIMCHGHRQFVLLKIYYSKCAMKGTKCDILCDE